MLVQVGGWWRRIEIGEEKRLRSLQQKARWVLLTSCNGVHRPLELWPEEGLLQRSCGMPKHNLEGQGQGQRAGGGGLGLKQELKFPVDLFTGVGHPKAGCYRAAGENRDIRGPEGQCDSTQMRLRRLWPLGGPSGKCFQGSRADVKSQE